MASLRESRGRTLGELAHLAQARLDGDGAVVVERVATLERAGACDIAFLANPRYRGQLKNTHADGSTQAVGCRPAGARDDGCRISATRA